MTDAFQGLAGQERAVEALRAALEQPVPSYLFTGPAGGGMRATAIAFAAELLAQGSQDPERIRRLVLAEQHPDLILFERCLLYTSPSPRDLSTSRMPSSA